MTSISSAAGTVAEGDGVLDKVRRNVLPIVFLLYMFNYMDRANISYAQLGMGSALGISVATFGTISAVFFIAYVVFEIPSNMIMKKVGARLWLARIGVTWGIVTIATGFVQNTSQLYAARILLGVCEAGLFPGLLLYLTYWFRTQERSRGIAGMSLAQPVALIIGSITGGWILDHVEWFGMQSWRWVFILQGIPPILIGFWVLAFLADRPSKAKWLTKQESTWLEGEITRDYRAEDSDSMEIELAAMKDPKILYLALINLLYAVGLYGMTFFLPQVVKQLHSGYSSTNIGLTGAVPYVFGAAAMLVIARYSDRLRNRKGIVMVLLTTAVVGLVITMATRHHPNVAMVGLCLLAIGVFGYLGPFWALASESLPRAQTAVGLAVINCIAAGGGFFGPYFIGKTSKADDVTFGLLFPAVCMAVAVVMLVFVRPAKQQAPVLTA